MKKNVLIVSSICILVLGFIFLVSINAIISGSLHSSFINQLKSADGIKVLESTSVYGKLNGNGNGIQFFGSCLVECGDSHVLDNLVAKLEERYEIVGYCKQTSQNIHIKYLSNVQLAYSTILDSSLSSQYYSIFFYNSYHPLSNSFSLMGH